MKPGPSYLDETLGSWRDAREGLIAEVDNIPAAKLGFRPTADVRSVREQVHHILEVAYMMTGELTRPDTDFRRAPWPELLQMYAAHVYEVTAKNDLLRLLEEQMADAERRFRTAGDLVLLQYIENFDGSRWTRFQWLHHGIAQEMYHRGQLTLYARLLGKVPALTKRIGG